MNSAIHIVLLSGGSGTRLWPLSSDARSKQFLKVLRDSEDRHVSMVQRTFDQIARVLPQADVTVATCADQEGMLRLQVGSSCDVVTEPERRNTAPAILLACEYLRSERGLADDEVVVAMPIDSYVEDAYFSKIAEVAQAVRDGAGDIVLLGVEPTYPSEKYGYIVPRDVSGTPRQVESFKEKPDVAVAEALIARGALWNNCVFGMKIGYALSILGRYGSYSSYTDLRMRYSEMPNNSFDYEVVEKASSVAVVPYAGEWKDLGTWNTLTEEMREATSGWTILDYDSCPNTHVVNELDVPVVVAGISDAVIVATGRGILVCSKELSTRLKEYIPNTNLPED